MPLSTDIRDVSEIDRFEASADVIVVGLGCAGASAAMEASDTGADVLVVERAGGGGGTSANSGGLIYLGGGTPVQEAAGFHDTPEELYKFLMAASSPAPDEAKIRLFSEGSVEHFHWLEAQGVPFKRSFYPEPSMESETDDCLVFSGGEDAAPYKDIARPAARAHKPQTLGKAGPFFMQCMLEAVERRPLRVELNVRADALLRDSAGRVAGLVGRRAGTEVAFRARAGVVLSAGGFAMNEEMVARYVPQLALAASKNATEGDDGRGIRMGAAAGGALLRMDQAEVALATTIPNRLARGIFVNDRGQRFINEDTYYGHIGIEALFRQRGRVWMLLDEALYERNFIGQEPFHVADDIAEIETEAGFASGVLQATVAQYNRDAERGEDPLFGKRPEFLVPLRNPPYALLDCRAADGPYSGLTAGGLATSADGEVLDIEGAPIPGLYAAGRTAALFCGRGYAGSGISLADGTFFGRRAGRHAAQKR
ncbi:MAG: FAD-dependent oxidoreductase [Myxococcales bacterium]|nr:FAD-dependent oxidoreductase [Myxococcales bacterium]